MILPDLLESAFEVAVEANPDLLRVQRPLVSFATERGVVHSTVGLLPRPPPLKFLLGAWVSSVDATFLMLLLQVVELGEEVLDFGLEGGQFGASVHVPLLPFQVLGNQLLHLSSITPLLHR